MRGRAPSVLSTSLSTRSSRNRKLRLPLIRKTKSHDAVTLASSPASVRRGRLRRGERFLDLEFLAVTERQKRASGNAAIQAHAIHRILHARRARLADALFANGIERHLQSFGLLAIARPGGFEHLRAKIRKHASEPQDRAGGAQFEGWLDDGCGADERLKIPRGSGNNLADDREPAGAFLDARNV